MSFLKGCAVFVVIIIHAIIAEDPKPVAEATQGYDHKGFFQYANVPGPSEYEFGYNRGSDSHQTSRFEQLKDSTFRTKVKWSDGYEGKGEHLWEYNHDKDYANSNPSPAYVVPTSAEVPSSLQAPDLTYQAPTPAPAPSYSTPLKSAATIPYNSIPVPHFDDDDSVPIYVPQPTTAPLPVYPKVIVPPYQPKRSVAFP